jgi:hypothetical protein
VSQIDQKRLNCQCLWIQQRNGAVLIRKLDYIAGTAPSANPANNVSSPALILRFDHAEESLVSLQLASCLFMFPLRGLYCGFSALSLIPTDELAGCARSTRPKRIALQQCESDVIVDYTDSSYLCFLQPAKHTRSRYLRTLCWWWVKAPPATGGSRRSHFCAMVERQSKTEDRRASTSYVVNRLESILGRKSQGFSSQVSSGDSRDTEAGTGLSTPDP